MVEATCVAVEVTSRVAAPENSASVRFARTDPLRCTVTLSLPAAPALAYQISASSPNVSPLPPAARVQVFPWLSVTAVIVTVPAPPRAKAPTRVSPAATALP